MTRTIRRFLVISATLLLTCFAATAAAQDLHTAAGEGDLKLIKQLLKDGAEVDQPDANFGFTPLVAAIIQNQHKAVRLLIKNGADVNATAMEGNTPLHAAAFLGYDKVAKELLRGGADPVKVNAQGQAPDGSAKVDWQTTQYLASMLQLTLDEEEVKAGREKVIAQLDKAIQKLARKDIWLAILTDNPRYVKRLVRKVEDIDQLDPTYRNSMIGLATFLGHADIVDILADAGANVNSRSEDGATPLIAGALFGRADAVQVLLDHGADPNLASNDGTTPLAAANADMAIVDYIASLLSVELDYNAVIAGKKRAAEILSAN